MVQSGSSSQPAKLVGGHSVFRGNLEGLSGAFGNFQMDRAGMIAVKETLKANGLNDVS